MAHCEICRVNSPERAGDLSPSKNGILGSERHVSSSSMGRRDVRRAAGQSRMPMPAQQRVRHATDGSRETGFVTAGVGRRPEVRRGCVPGHEIHDTVLKNFRPTIAVPSQALSPTQTYSWCYGLWLRRSWRGDGASWSTAMCRSRGTLVRADAQHDFRPRQTCTDYGHCSSRRAARNPPGLPSPNSVHRGDVRSRQGSR